MKVPKNALIWFKMSLHCQGKVPALLAKMSRGTPERTVTPAILPHAAKAKLHGTAQRQSQRRYAHLTVLFFQERLQFNTGFLDSAGGSRGAERQAVRWDARQEAWPYPRSR